MVAGVGADQRRGVYRVGEFAALTAVSVRTLHHYDRIGLLKPSGHSEAGYRLYAESDLLRLQQILTLRYLGFALAEIGRLLDQSDFNLVASMHIQRDVLRERIAELGQVEAALERLLDGHRSSGDWDWCLLAETSAVMERRLRRKGVDVNQYYSPEEMQRRLEEHAAEANVTQAEIEQIQNDWTQLLREIRANDQLDPASPEARALADRWRALSEQTIRSYRQDEKLIASIREGYRQGRYQQIEGAPRPEDVAFIERVNQARQGGEDE